MGLHKIKEVVKVSCTAYDFLFDGHIVGQGTMEPSNEGEEGMMEPSDDEEGNLSLTALAEEVARVLKSRKRPRNEEEEEEKEETLEGQQMSKEELEHALEAYATMKVAYEARILNLHAANKAFNARMAKFMGPQHSLFGSLQNIPGGRPIDVERAIVKQVLPGMYVQTALRLASVLRAVYEVVRTDDELWHYWFQRDCAEVATDLGGDFLPDWLLNSPRAGEIPHYAKMPWRRYYMWYTFFRRAALREIASLESKFVVKWIAKRWWRIAEMGTWPMTVRYTPEEKWFSTGLIVPSFSHEGGRQFFLALQGANDQDHFYFPEKLYEPDGQASEVLDITIDQNGNDMEDDEVTHELIADARSPVYWLPRFLHRLESLTASKLGYWSHGMHDDATMRPQEFRTSTTKSDRARGGLNFDREEALTCFVSWYAQRYSRADLPDVPGIASLVLNNFIVQKLEKLPPIPIRNGWWFVGKSVCVGCDVQGDMSARCKRCGKAYCSVECHGVNWQKSCSDCVK